MIGNILGAGDILVNKTKKNPYPLDTNVVVGG